MTVRQPHRNVRYVPSTELPMKPNAVTTRLVSVALIDWYRAVCLRREAQRVRRVHHSLGLAGRAGREHEEREFVGRLRLMRTHSSRVAGRDEGRPRCQVRIGRRTACPRRIQQRRTLPVAALESPPWAVRLRLGSPRATSARASLLSRIAPICSALNMCGSSATTTPAWAQPSIAMADSMQCRP